MRRIGCRILNCTEPEYPQSLLQIYDSPVLLYVRGDVSVLNAPSLSIVGTRRPTIYGTQMAQRLGRDLAKRGLVIVSGLARGVDALSHAGAVRRRSSDWSARNGYRRLLSQGEQKVVRKGPRERRHHQRIANGLSSRTGELAGPAIASLREGLWVLSLLRASNVAARELRLDWRWSSAEKVSADPET
jgi:DNA recombination-mediator protein A